MSEVKCFPVDRELAATQPHAAIYASVHGKWNLMPGKWNDADLGAYKSTEDVYRACLKKGVTWQELLNYKQKEKLIL